LNFGSPEKSSAIGGGAAAEYDPFGTPPRGKKPVPRALFGDEGGGAAAVAPAAAASPPPFNKGVAVDDDNAIEIYRDRVGKFGEQFVAVKDLHSINADADAVQRLIQAHPTYTQDDFNSGRTPNGLFTFLVVVDHDVHRLVAKEVRSMLEIGTRHHSIAKDASLGISRILCGGEIEKTAAGLRFNLQSGHYTVTRFRKDRLTGKINEANSASKSEAYSLAVQALLLAAVYVQFSPDVTFIREGAFRPLDAAELGLYTECGLSVFLFGNAVEALAFQSEVGNDWEDDAVQAQLDANHGVLYVPPAAVAAVAAEAVGPAPRKSRNRKTRRARKQNRRRKTTRRRKF